MIEKLPNFFTEPYKLVNSNNNSFLVALSGGSDSAALLHILCKYRELTGIKLYAAHVNHNIRTDEYENEALRDENFCRKLCKDNGVELFVEKVNIPKLSAESGNSLETEARLARYEFFARVMNGNGINVLVTAHNADDNLETQIFNLCRGCGTDGICGIPPVRSFDDVENGYIIRPIISASKKDILSFCEENSIEYVTDSTNFEENCTRNMIRHRIIPQLKEIFNSPERAAIRLSTSAFEDKEFIFEKAYDFLKNQSNGINVDELLSLHPAVAKRALKAEFENHSKATMETVHIQSVLDFASCGKNGCVSLPGKIKAIFNNGKLSFAEDTREKVAKEEFNKKLSLGSNVLDNSIFLIFVSESSDHSEYIAAEGNTYRYFSSALIKNVDIDNLYASNRFPGDKIKHGGMSKKIKKIMCDKKVDQSIRDIIPIVRANDIVYAPLCAVSDRFVASKQDFNYNIIIYRLQIGG